MTESRGQVSSKVLLLSLSLRCVAYDVGRVSIFWVLRSANEGRSKTSNRFPQSQMGVCAARFVIQRDCLLDKMQLSGNLILITRPIKIFFG
jgi:hypothetical protein